MTRSKDPELKIRTDLEKYRMPAEVIKTESRVSIFKKYGIAKQKFTSSERNRNKIQSTAEANTISSKRQNYTHLPTKISKKHVLHGSKMLNISISLFQHHHQHFRFVKFHTLHG